MRRHDWFRKTTWSESDQKDFQDRLRRCRGEHSKTQALRIQASHLAGVGKFNESLDLLRQFFRDYPPNGESASAHLQMAECFIALGKDADAIKEFRLSLDAERSKPKWRTTCWLDFGWFVVSRAMTELYPEVAAVLTEFLGRTGLLFAKDQYMHSGISAIILAERGDMSGAQKYAALAIEASKEDHSGFRYHPKVGLVRNTDAVTHAILQKLSRQTP